MSLKKLSKFIKEDIEPDKNCKKPDVRTIRKFPGVVKMGCSWWIDMDSYNAGLKTNQATGNLLNELTKDPDVAELIGSD